MSQRYSERESWLGVNIVNVGKEPKPESCTFNAANGMPVWFYGFRENVDPEALKPYLSKFPELTVDRWPSLAETIAKVCEQFFEQCRKLLRSKAKQASPSEAVKEIREILDLLTADPFAKIGGLAASECALNQTGSFEMVSELMLEPDFQAAWLETIQKVIGKLPEWEERLGRMFLEDFIKFQRAFDRLVPEVQERIRQAFQVKYGHIVSDNQKARTQAWIDVQKWMRETYSIPKDGCRFGSHIVTFVASRDGKPMVRIDRKVSFPERSGKQPKVGEKWEVEVSGTNPKGTVQFLRLVRKID